MQCVASFTARGVVARLATAARATSAPPPAPHAVHRTAATAVAPLARRLVSARANSKSDDERWAGLSGLTEKCREPATGGFAHRPDDTFDLSGSTAFITGGAQGIGAAIAVAMARHGADVIIADIAGEDKMAAVTAQIEELGRKAVAVQCDVRRRSLTNAAMAEAVEKMGRGPDILVASAGIIGRLERAHEVSHDGWTEVFAVNCEGSYNAAQACYPYMAARGGGKVVFISSIAGTRSAGAQVAYSCSKGAVLSLSRSLAAAWGSDNIQVNCLVPGAINTGFLDTMLANPKKLEYILGRIPTGRLGVAADMVGPALFLASHASDYVTGAEISVDGGGAVLPMLAAQDPNAYKVPASP